MSLAPRKLLVFRFTLREMLWIVLLVGVATGWWTESLRGRQWRQRADIAAGQLEAEGLGRMVFERNGVYFKSSYYDAPLQESFIPTDTAP